MVRDAIKRFFTLSYFNSYPCHVCGSRLHEARVNGDLKQGHWYIFYLSGLIAFGLAYFLFGWLLGEYEGFTFSALILAQFLLLIGFFFTTLYGRVRHGLKESAYNERYRHS